MDNIISLFYTLFGLSYTILAGSGKYICFIFGLLASILYSYLSFKNAIYGSFLLNFLYYIPIQIISLFNWKKNTEKNTVLKTKLQRKVFLAYLLISTTVSLIASYVLYLNHDKSPILDGFILIFSILGAYLTLKRTIEQWIVWTTVNALSFIMWIILIINGSKAIFSAVLWFLYLILGIVYYFKWKRELGQL